MTELSPTAKGEANWNVRAHAHAKHHWRVAAKEAEDSRARTMSAKFKKLEMGELCR